MKIATPISSLFSNAEQAQAIIAASDCLECRDHSPGNEWPAEELFHTDIQPIHIISNPEWDHLQDIRDTKPNLKVLSLHLASCCDQPVIVDGRFQPGGKSHSRTELLAMAGQNLRRIRQIFGGSVELAVENNNYYPTPAYRYVCDADFIAELVRQNELRFLFDLAHAHITSVNQGVPYHTYKENLPLDALIQVHLCKHGMLEDGSAYDAHEPPGPEEFTEVREVAATHPLQYLTIEYYRSTELLVKCLETAQHLKHEIAQSVV